jgi:hypothetical protein
VIDAAIVAARPVYQDKVSQGRLLDVGRRSGVSPPNQNGYGFFVTVRCASSFGDCVVSADVLAIFTDAKGASGYIQYRQRAEERPVAELNQLYCSRVVSAPVCTERWEGREQETPRKHERSRRRTEASLGTPPG